MPTACKVTFIGEALHEYEQLGYAEIRRALTESFIASPEEFVAHFGRRPEDLQGADLREYYPHFLVQQIPLESTNEGFRKRFLRGDLF